MRSRIYPHRNLIRIFTRDSLIHVEEVAVAFGDHRLSEAPDGVAEIEANTPAVLTDSPALVHGLFGTTRRNIAGGEIAKARVDTLEVVVPVFFRNVFRSATVTRLLRYPNAPIVAQRLAHQREL